MADATELGRALNAINLHSYIDALVDEGFEAPADLCELDDAETTALGKDLNMKRGEVSQPPSPLLPNPSKQILGTAR